MNSFPNLDFILLFRLLPEPTMIIRNNTPRYTIVAANDAYLRVTGTARDYLLGMGIFEAFPENPFDTADGPAQLLASFKLVAETGLPHKLDLQHYDIPVPGSDLFETRYWQIENTPVPENGATGFIINTVKDVTDAVIGQRALETARRNYEQLIQSLDGIVWEARISDLQFTYVSPQSEYMLGYKPEEWYAEPDFWQKRIHPEDVQAALEFCAAQTALGNNHRFEYRMLTADGRAVWLSDVVSLVKENGVPVLLRGVMTDITEKKAAELKQRELYERYTYVTKATFDTVWDWDLENGFFSWGEGFQTIFGYNLSALKKDISSWTDFIHPDDLEKITGEVKKALDGKADHWTGEYRVRKADGHYSIVYDKGLIIRNGAGKATRMVGAMQDITRRKEDEKRMAELNLELVKHTRRLSASNELLEQFAYVASHDLQEPLRMITGFLSQLEKKYQDQLDEKARQYIKFAVDGAGRMRQIILSLLEYSRLSYQTHDPEEVDLNKLLENIIVLNRQKISETGTVIRYDAMPVIRSSNIALQQVFNNLISNAIKYQKKGARPQVKIGFEEQDETYQFCVQDNGIGIAPEYHQTVFLIFKRLHNQTEYSGTGIGLPICKRIVESMGGQIWIRSAVGEGSSFFFTIKKIPTH